MSACVRCRSNLPPQLRVCPVCRAPQPLGPHTLQKGHTIDLARARVVLDSKVGEGGMGVVWRGWLFYDPSGPRGKEPPLPVAIKALLPHTAPEAQTLFKNEAESLRQFLHPNIVGFIDLIEQESTPMLIMEYVDGDTLEQVIERHIARARQAKEPTSAGIPLLRAWYYFHQLLGALATTHALGIVHSDVKPSNLLIRKDGIAKLTDFGIARLTASNSVAPLAGTALYMSPEQVLGHRLDARSDLYSAAVVLFEMLCGRPPFTSPDDDIFAVRQQHVEAPPPSLRQFERAAPPIVDAIFGRAMAKNPLHRYQSAIEMGEEFRRALNLPEHALWTAQAELAELARHPHEVSGQISAITRPLQPGVKRDRAGTLRQFLVRGYQTMRVSQLPPV